MLVISAEGDINGTNLRRFQGAMYSTNLIDVSGGNTGVEGPLVCPNVIVPGQQVGSTWPNISTVVTGSAGTPQAHYTLTKTYDNN